MTHWELVLTMTLGATPFIAVALVFLLHWSSEKTRSKSQAHQLRLRILECQSQNADYRRVLEALYKEFAPGLSPGASPKDAVRAMQVEQERRIYDGVRERCQFVDGRLNGSDEAFGKVFELFVAAVRQGQRNDPGIRAAVAGMGPAACDYPAATERAAAGAEDQRGTGEPGVCPEPASEPTGGTVAAPGNESVDVQSVRPEGDGRDIPGLCL